MQQAAQSTDLAKAHVAVLIPSIIHVLRTGVFWVRQPPALLLTSPPPPSQGESSLDPTSPLYAARLALVQLLHGATIPEHMRTLARVRGVSGAVV